MPFAVRDNASGDIVGSTRYFNVDAANRRLEIGHHLVCAARAATRRSTPSASCLAADARASRRFAASRSSSARTGSTIARARRSCDSARNRTACCATTRCMPDGSRRPANRRAASSTANGSAVKQHPLPQAPREPAAEAMANFRAVRDASDVSASVAALCLGIAFSGFRRSMPWPTRRGALRCAQALAFFWLFLGVVAVAAGAASWWMVSGEDKQIRRTAESDRARANTHMLVGFFLHLKSFKLPGLDAGVPDAAGGARQSASSRCRSTTSTRSRARASSRTSSISTASTSRSATYFKGVDAIFDIRAEIPEEWLQQGVPALLVRRRQEAASKRWAARDKLHGDVQEAPRGAARAAPGRQRSGSAPAAPARSAPTATTRRAFASGRTAAARAARSKCWDERAFRNLDGDVELNTRNIKVALRRLRASRAKACPRSSTSTARSRARRATRAGSTLRLQPERRNRVKVLLFLDVGGSMDPHVQVCEELFSAAKAEFRHLEYFYFHNCVYDHVWRDNARRRNERVGDAATSIRTYGPDWKRDLRRRRRDEPLRAHCRPAAASST